jgi:hypothetical protein
MGTRIADADSARGARHSALQSLQCAFISLERQSRG